jgi:hypothetical protein
VADDGTVILPAEFDQFLDDVHSAPLHSWLICRPCHQELTNDPHLSWYNRLRTRFGAIKRQRRPTLWPSDAAHLPGRLPAIAAPDVRERSFCYSNPEVYASGVFCVWDPIDWTDLRARRVCSYAQDRVGFIENTFCHDATRPIRDSQPFGCGRNAALDRDADRMRIETAMDADTVICIYDGSKGAHDWNRIELLAATGTGKRRSRTILAKIPSLGAAALYEFTDKKITEIGMEVHQNR